MTNPSTGPAKKAARGERIPEEISPAEDGAPRGGRSDIADEQSDRQNTGSNSSPPVSEEPQNQDEVPPRGSHEDEP